MDNFPPLKANNLKSKIKKSASDMTQQRSVSGEINLLCFFLEQRTWTQNHVSQILTYEHCNITVKRVSLDKKIILVNSHHSPIYLLSFSEFKSDTPTQILPYEFIHGQVSPATLTRLILPNVCPKTAAEKSAHLAVICLSVFHNVFRKSNSHK